MRFQSAMVRPMLELIHIQHTPMIEGQHAALPLLVEKVPGVMLHHLLISSRQIDCTEIKEGFLQIVRSLASARLKLA